MKNLLAVAFGLTLALSVAGCGKKGAVDAIKDWADQSCKCKDEDCAKKQKDAFDKLEHDFKKDFDNESTQKAAEPAYHKGNECLAKFGVEAG